MIQLSFGNRSLSLEVSPHEVGFSYNLNTATTDTVGGKVVQILSTNISDMSVSSKISTTDGAGFRKYLDMVRFCRDMMVYHAQEHKPGRFIFPTLGYDMRVYLRNQSFTESFNQVVYPYTLNFMVEEDISGVATTNALESEFAKVKAEIGYIPGKAGWHGGLE